MAILIRSFKPIFYIEIQADFIEELVRGRLVEESLTPAILTAYNLQVILLFLLPHICLLKAIAVCFSG